MSLSDGLLRIVWEAERDAQEAYMQWRLSAEAGEARMRVRAALDGAL